MARWITGAAFIVENGISTQKPEDILNLLKEKRARIITSSYSSHNYYQRHGGNTFIISSYIDTFNGGCIRDLDGLGRDWIDLREFEVCIEDKFFKREEIKAELIKLVNQINDKVEILNYLDENKLEQISEHTYTLSKVPSIPRNVSYTYSSVANAFIPEFEDVIDQYGNIIGKRFIDKFALTNIDGGKE